MSLAFALAIGTLFGAGAYLVLKPNLFRVVAGLVLIGNAANLTVIGAGLGRGQAPILPLTPGEPVADPLTQALALTAIVIGFATTALMLGLVVRLYRTERSVDLDELSRAEARTEAVEERDEVTT